MRPELLFPSLFLLLGASATAQNCCDSTMTLLDESFEGGLPAGWEVTFAGVSDACPRASICDGSQWMLLADPSSCDIFFGIHALVKTPFVSLPAGATGLRLTYCSALDVTGASATVGSKYLFIPVTVDVPTTSLDWETRVVDLPLVGQSVWFDLISTGPGTSGFWMVDHVRIEALFGGLCDEIGTRYCPAVANSTGQPGRMDVLGSDVVADDHLVLNATQLPTNSNIGYFIMGTGMNTFTPPGSAGPICVAPGIQRYLPPVNNTNQLPGGFCRSVGTSGPVSGSITPGSTWNFQAWHRDGMNPSNLTDAISVTFQ